MVRWKIPMWVQSLYTVPLMSNTWKKLLAATGAASGGGCVSSSSPWPHCLDSGALNSLILRNFVSWKRTVADGDCHLLSSGGGALTCWVLDKALGLPAGGVPQPGALLFLCFFFLFTLSKYSFQAVVRISAIICVLIFRTHDKHFFFFLMLIEKLLNTYKLDR